MKILHVNDCKAWRGGEAQTLLLARGLVGMGHECLIAGPEHGELGFRARAAGVAVEPLSIWGETDITAGVRLRNIAQRFSADIIHAHTGHAVAISAMAKLLRPRTKFVLTRRVDYPLRKNPFTRVKYARLPDAVIAISGAVRDVLIRGGVPESNIHLVHSGIDLMKFGSEDDRTSTRNLLRIPLDVPVIGCVAALSEDKAHEILLAAARVVVQQEPSVRFLLVGGGPREREIRALCTSYGLDHNVIFTGFRDDIGSLLRAMDIFTLSSRTEGMGTSILDAMVVGLAVVATRAGGIPEIVKDGVTGMLSPVDDHEALAGNFLQAVRDPDLRKKYGDAGRLHVAEFSAESMTRGTELVYRRLLGANA